MGSGIRKLAELWLKKSPKKLAQQSGLFSLRLLERLIGEVQEALPEPMRMMIKQPQGREGHHRFLHCM